MMIIQQVDQFPDGISEVEKRASRDLAEHAAATQVYVVNLTKEITERELSYFVKVR